MGSGLGLVLLFLLSGLRSVSAGDLDVLPQETIVPQCTTITALWSQTPPIHLHVQPDDSITITNLVDLGVQNDSFTTFKVTLPLGQNFSFAYNTLADPFAVFQSNVMQVGPGTSDCLDALLAPTISESNSNTPSTSLAGISTPTTASTSNSPPATPVVAPETATASSGISRPLTPFPVGAVIGILCAIATVVLIALAAFWRVHRRAMKRLADLHADPEGSAPSAAPAPKFFAPIFGRGREDPIPYNESAPPPPSSPTKSTLKRGRERGSSSSSRSSDDDLNQPTFAPQNMTIDIPKARRLVLNSPTTPTTAVPSPRLHIDGGVRIRHPEELPPLYHDYNSS
ncbi:hypothetical protein B0H19DRAFT_1226866 [Mycena capillaripes]|nr:hypothetical protein B0H19DRAFT_1226866 [Mycena capillaripes]